MTEEIHELTRLIEAVVDADISAHTTQYDKRRVERDLVIWVQNNRASILAGLRGNALKWQVLADRAICMVEDAVRETSWGQPTFGPDFGEALRADYDELLGETAPSSSLVDALEFMVNVSRSTPGFSAMAREQAERALEAARNG